MSYTVSSEAIKDPWVRGTVDAFAKFVEIRNNHPEWIDDKAIAKLYEETRDWCTLETKLIVKVDGEALTE